MSKLPRSIPENDPLMRVDGFGRLRLGAAFSFAGEAEEDCVHSIPISIAAIWQVRKPTRDDKNHAEISHYPICAEIAYLQMIGSTPNPFLYIEVAQENGVYFESTCQISMSHESIPCSCIDTPEPHVRKLERLCWLQGSIYGPG